MKYQPKEGDFVKCSSIKEKVELLKLAQVNEYKIYEPSIETNSEHLIYINRWMGSGDKTGDKKRILTPKMFKSLISGVKYEFEEDDAVKAPLKNCVKSIHY